MAERSVVAPVRSMDDRFWFWSERNVDEIVRFAGDCVHVLPMPETEATEDGEDQEAVPETEEEEEESDDDDDSEEEESDDDDDSEEEEESDGEFEDEDVFLLQKVHARKFVPEARFLGGADPQFVAEGRTGGFMRVAAADEENEGGGGERQILVHYRYTRFSAACSSDGIVEACGSSRDHQIRFIAAGDHGARSLAWAGASLAHLIYPGGSSKRLRELWTSLASHVSLPSRAARVEVFVEVGILRKANYTEASMGHMRDALKKSMMAQTWPERFTGMELNLPEPVRCGHDEDKAAHDKDTDGKEQKPAKRRRVVAAAGEDCSVCYEPLEGDDLAAWPGCGKPHVLHGACMHGVLESNPFCPMCRRGLDIEPKF